MADQFLSMVNRHTARAVRRGTVDPARQVAESVATFPAEKFGADNPLKQAAVHWSAPSNAISTKKSAELFPDESEHDPEAPISVLHGRLGSDIRVNDRSVVRMSGVTVPRHNVDVRGWTPAAHATSPDVASQVADLVKSGRHGLLASTHGASGAGVYAFSDDYAGKGGARKSAETSYNEGAVVEGIALAGRSAFDHPVTRAAAARHGNVSISEHVGMREAMLQRGVGHVPDRNGGLALLHPSQFRVTAIHTAEGSQHFDPSEQRFRPGDPVWAPKTYGK